MPNNDDARPTLADLLARWADLAPEECYRCDEQGIYGFGGDLSVYQTGDSLEDPAEWGQVLTAVLLAAAKRGWLWSMAYYRSRNEYGAGVQRVIEGDIIVPPVHGYADTPAAAALAAYVAALEARAGAGGGA